MKGKEEVRPAYMSISLLSWFYIHSISKLLALVFFEQTETIIVMLSKVIAKQSHQCFIMQWPNLSTLLKIHTS